MIERAAGLAAAAAALLLAASAARTWRAERMYEAGIDLGVPATDEAPEDQPARDVAGRLEAYERAVAADPGQPLYALRAGQILLQRAARRPRPDDRDDLVRRATARLRDAIRLHPLEGRAHDAVAQSLAMSDDLDGALRHTLLSVLLSPRRPSALDRASSRYAWVWRRTLDPDVLTRALDTARLGYEFADGRSKDLGEMRWAPGTRAVEDLLAAPAGPTRDDLELAVRGRDDLREPAARLLERIRPGDAAALRAGAGR